MKIRLTESDLHSLISSAVKKILKEGLETNEMLSKIVQTLSSEITPDDGAEGMHKKQISIDDIEVILEYEVEEGRVYIGLIEIYNMDGKIGNINDNGMVANAIASLTGCDQYDSIKDDPTFRGGGF